MDDSHNFYATIGRYCKELRIKNKMSQQKLADYLGMERTSIVNFEKGNQKLSAYKIYTIGIFLGANIFGCIESKKDSFQEQNKISLIKARDCVSELRHQLDKILL